VLHSEAATTHRAALLDGTASAAVQAVALPGLAIPGDWHAAALADRARRCRAFVDAHLREHQILLLPALAEPVPDWQVVALECERFEPRQLLALYRYMGFVNYLGLPALLLPVAADRQGMPISVQLIARPFHERLLLEFAHALERDRFGPEGITRAFLSKGSIH
jgi:Asp-tRNA(Asn)/Glu-tRNA(Gln) amidotransferase A subunit family amidase